MYEVSSCITERKTSVATNKISQLAMFKEIIGVYRENSWKQEMTQSGNKWRGCICVSNEANQVHTNCQYIYFSFSTCFGQLYVHHQENLLYLCDTGIFHSVWVAVWSADQTATHTEHTVVRNM